MATWKVQITAKRRPAIDPDQLLGAVLALGRQFAEEKRQQLRETAKAQSERSPEGQPADRETSAAATSQPEVR